jgi:hypothetical protein
MAEIDPLARLLGVLENKLDTGLARFAEHSAEDARQFALLRIEIRETIERLAREQAEAVRRIEESLDRLVGVPGEIAAMREVLHGADGSSGLVAGVRKITAIIDGDRGRRAAYALIGALLVGLVGIGSGIANLWHLLFSNR